MRRTSGIYRQLKEIAASHLMLRFSKSLKCTFKSQRVMNPPLAGHECTFPCSPRDLSVLLRREKQYLWALLRAGLNRGRFIRRKGSDITSKLMLFIKRCSPLLMTRQLQGVIKEGLKVTAKALFVVRGRRLLTSRLSAPKPILTRAPKRRLKGTACLNSGV